MSDQDDDLRKELDRLREENRYLKAQPAGKSAATECPFYRIKAASLKDIVPHEHQDMAGMGVRQKIYECTNCGREFREDIT